MRSFAFTLCAHAFAFLAALGACFHAAFADESVNLVKKITVDWAKRQQQIDRMRYSLVDETLIPKGALNVLKTDMDNPPAGDVPPRDYRYEQRIGLMFDLDTNRIRKEYQGEIFDASRGKYVPDSYLKTFIGRKVYVYTPNDRLKRAGRELERYAPDLEYQSGNKQAFFFHFVEFPLYWGHGLLMRMDVKSLRTPINGDIYRVHGNVKHQGRDCTVLRTSPQSRSAANFVELWVDTGRESAILRCAFFVDSEESTTFDVKYQHTSHGWLPKTWVINKFGDKNRSGTRPLIESHKLKVTDFAINPDLDDSLFRFQEKAGMVILDTLTGRHYVKGRPGEPDVDVSELLLRERDRSTWWLWVVGSTIAILLALVAIRIYIARRRRESAATGKP